MLRWLGRSRAKIRALTYANVVSYYFEPDRLCFSGAIDVTLIEQIRKIVQETQEIPDDPAASLSGTELVEIVRPKLIGEFADNSLRQTFSVLVGDPTSPLARAEIGYGYFRRARSQQAQPVSEEPMVQATVDGSEGRDNQPEEKFRAFYLRMLKLDNKFPVHIEHLAGSRRQAGVNKWKFPDVVFLDWDVGEANDAGFALNPDTLAVKRGLGEQPFGLSSVELKIDLSLSTFREFFFQCVSNSKWAHAAKLVIACPIADNLLANEMRRLGASYGVAVSTFNFSRDALKSVPAASKILALKDDEFEKLFASYRVENTLTAGAARSVLDWEHINDMKAQSDEFKSIFAWIARCLRDTTAFSFENYRRLIQIEQTPG